MKRCRIKLQISSISGGKKSRFFDNGHKKKKCEFYQEVAEKKSEFQGHPKSRKFQNPESLCLAPRFPDNGSCTVQSFKMLNIYKPF